MIFKICGIALIGAALAFIMKNYGWRGASLISIAGMLTLLLSLGQYFEKISVFFDTAMGSSTMNTAAESGLKVLGIGYFSGICSDICRELGEVGIASVMALLFRLEMLTVVFPMVIEIMNIGLELVG